MTIIFKKGDWVSIKKKSDLYDFLKEKNINPEGVFQVKSIDAKKATFVCMGTGSTVSLSDEHLKQLRENLKIVPSNVVRREKAGFH
jgi:hypothetical protein